MDIHQTVKKGFMDATTYEAVRPSYTEELVNHTVKSLYHCPDDKRGGVVYDILELGAGTGKFTRLIGPQVLRKGVSYLATDPMKHFINALQQQLPDTKTELCTAANIPLPDSSVQNIICAQSFHWFADERSLTEMRRIIVPGGRLIMVWNTPDFYSLGWMSEIREIMDEYYGSDTPRAYTHEWKHAIDDFPGFRLKEHSLLDGLDNLRGNKDFILGVMMSGSAISALNDEEKVVAMSRFKAVLDRHFPESDIVLQIPSNMEFYCAEKI